MAEDEARAIAEQILQAAFILHENELMHFDIKPKVKNKYSLHLFYRRI